MTTNRSSPTDWERSRRLLRPLAGSRAPDKFWGHREAWPADGVNHVFLARAVDQLGQAMFAAKWTGVEFAGSAPVFPGTTDRIYATRGAVLRAAELLKENRSELWANRSPELDGQLNDLRACDDLFCNDEAAVIALFYFTDTEWEEAHELITSSGEELEPGAASQWESVLKALTHPLRTGALPSFMRNVECGDFRMIEPFIWDNEKWPLRFVSCKIDEAAPFSSEFPKKEVYRASLDGQKPVSSMNYIYVGRAALGELLQKQPEASALLARLTYLPPYMEIMVLAACRLGYGLGKSLPQKGDIEYELYQLANDRQMPLSKSLLSYLATALGPLNPQKGSGPNKFEQAIRDGEIAEDWHTKQPFKG